jgi:hypothetical protein
MLWMVLRLRRGSALVPPDTPAYSRVAIRNPVTSIQPCRTLASGNPRADHGPGCIAFTEPRYLFRSAVNAALALSYQIPLSLIKHSLLSTDKMLFSAGEIITLNFVLARFSQYVWESTGVVPNNAPIVLNPAPVCSDMNLYIATETNPVIIQGLRDRCAGPGLSLAIPYPLSQRVAQAAVGIGSSTMRLNRGSGSSLLRICFSVFQPGATLNQALNCSNDGNTIGGYYCSIDSARSTECDTLPRLGIDYLVNAG